MALDDHIISDLFSFAGVVVTQFFLYKATVARVTSNVAATQKVAAAEVKTAVCVQEQKIQSALTEHNVLVSGSFADVQTALKENTKISKDAFHEANNANMKIAAALKVKTTSSDQQDRIEALVMDTNQKVSQ